MNQNTNRPFRCMHLSGFLSTFISVNGIALVLILFLSACGESEDNVADSGTGVGDSGTTTTDGGNSPDANTVNCATTSTGCTCSTFARDELSTCSPTSLDLLGYGVCCDSPGLSCECTELGCAQWANGDHCECGVWQIVKTWSSTKQGQCLPATLDSNCCQSTSAFGENCVCSADECEIGATPVASCSVASVSECSVSTFVSECQ